MPARQTLFEGPSLEPLLERIHRELGPQAQILSAERVRQGGFLGFFAREQFRLCVQLPEVAPPPDTAPTTPLLRTVEVPTAGEAAAPLEGAGAAVPAGVGAALAQGAGAALPQGVGAALPQGVGAALPQGVGAALPQEVGDGRAKRRVSRRRAVAVDLPAPGTTPAEEGQGPAGQMALALDDQPPDAEVARSSALAALADATADVIEVVAPLPSTESENFATVLQRVARTVESDGALVAGESRGTPRSTILEEAIGTELTTASPGASPAVPSAGELAITLDRAGLAQPIVHQVLMALEAGADLTEALLRAFGCLPGPPPVPANAGSLLAVVGSGARAWRLAASIADELDIDPTTIAHASIAPTGELAGPPPGGTVVRSAREAAIMAPTWRGPKVALVSVDAPLAGGHRTWARHVLTALRPTAIWGVVDAYHKVEDVLAWADNIGGVEALAVEHLDDTVSPGAVLAAGLPVVRLDGHRATPARWAVAIGEAVARCA